MTLVDGAGEPFAEARILFFDTEEEPLSSAERFRTSMAVSDAVVAVVVRRSSSPSSECAAESQRPGLSNLQSQSGGVFGALCPG